VATRKRKKRSWTKTVLIYTTIPLTVWLLAFVLWFYWREISAAFNPLQDQPRPDPKSTRSDTTPSKRPRENILEEDRKKLEDILKRRG
jgi:superfamily I DNA and/or RNA helicase